MNTKEIEVNPTKLKLLFLELQDREVLMKHLMEEIEELQDTFKQQQKVVREIRGDLKAHLGINF